MAHLQSYNRDNPLKHVGNDANNTSNDAYSQCSENDIANKSLSSSEDNDDDQCFNLLPLLNYGICVPDTCTEYDVRKMFHFCE